MKRIGVLLHYHWLSFWNWRSSYLSRVVEPVAYFAFLVVGFAQMPGIQAGYVQYGLSGMVALLTFRTGTAAVADVANDRKWGVMALHRMHGGRSSTYLASIVIFLLAIFLTQVLLLLGIGAILPDRSSIDVGESARALAIGMPVGVGWIGWGVAAGSRIQSYSVRDLTITLTSLPVVLAAPLFYDLDNVPRYLRAVAAANPLTYQVGWIRDTDLRGFELAVAWAAVGLVAAATAIRTSSSLSTER